VRFAPTGPAPEARRRMRLRVLFGPLCILLLAGCRTVDDDRHWGHHGHSLYGHYHTHRPVHPPFYRHHHVTPPALRHPSPPTFRYGHRWDREPHSGAGREHGPRHRRHGGHGRRRR
jgi:hypothetical protein